MKHEQANQVKRNNTYINHYKLKASQQPSLENKPSKKSEKGRKTTRNICKSMWA
jgi:hypothetical protein